MPEGARKRWVVVTRFRTGQFTMWVGTLVLLGTLVVTCVSFKRGMTPKSNGVMKLEMSSVARKGKSKSSSKNGNKVSTAAANALKNRESTLSTSSGGSFYHDLNKYPCLILNSDYRPLSHLPLSLWSWQDSLRALFSGRAVTVSTYEGITVRSVEESYELPSIIALTSYHRNPMNTPTMSRKGVFLRDNYCCQYCDTRFAGDASKLSLDHLVPRSRGGALTWENTVTACMACNFQKGANGPEELGAIGMRLKRKPYVPTAGELQGRAKNMKKYKIQHSDWEDYL